MRNLFGGYYPLSDEAVRELWAHGTFVVDANVLLNLYRYSEQARTDLLNALGKIGHRLWIPYQVALEFQRNRLHVLAGAVTRFDDVRKTIEKSLASLEGEFGRLQLTKRHAAIDAEELLIQFRAVADKFKSSLTTLEKQHGSLGGEDLIRKSIDDLFDGKIGPAYADQRQLDAVYEEGKRRFESQRPPGFLDAEKAEGKRPVFHHKGLQYQKQYGDLLLWKQTLAFAEEHKPKGLVLITDDDKADWWLLVDANGRKTLGPRPELIEEMFEVGVSTFHIYTSERFLGFAKDQLGALVSPTTVAEVRTAHSQPSAPHTRKEALIAVRGWLRKANPKASVRKGTQDLIDLELKNEEGVLIGYRVLRDLPALDRNVQNFVESPNDSKYDHYCIVIVAEKKEAALALPRKYEYLAEFIETLSERISVLIGFIPSGQEAFALVSEFRATD
jgi:hypothetical protein